MIVIESATPTHVAYADETAHNIGRYRGVALITFSGEHEDALETDLQKILQQADVREFKWTKLRTAKYRFAPLNMVDLAVKHAVTGILRVDVLMWDTQDSRHRFKGRDDQANLQRMYYQLFHYVLRDRWPDGSVWRLCPDRQDAIDWETVEDILYSVGSRIQAEPQTSLFRALGRASLRLHQQFGIAAISPCNSLEQPFVQLADLFAGLAAYSRTAYDRYVQWERSEDGQLSLFPTEETLSLSGADCQRFPVISRLNAQCKKHKLGVSLRSYGGLRTFDPRNPINFWWYKPQSVLDKAPSRDPCASQ